MHAPQDDIAVIQLVLQGQQAAYGVLVARYQQYVFTLVLRYVKDRELAEELAQDVFVKAYRYLADFKGNSKFSTWLYTIANTTCLSHIRKKGGKTVLLEEETMTGIIDNQDHEKPTALLEQKTTRIMLNKAIQQLPEQDAQLLALFYQAEQTVEEIGVIMELTTANVKVRLFRARGKLKEILETKFSREIDY